MALINIVDVVVDEIEDPMSWKAGDILIYIGDYPEEVVEENWPVMFISHNDEDNFEAVRLDNFDHDYVWAYSCFKKAPKGYHVILGNI